MWIVNSILPQESLLRLSYKDLTWDTAANRPDVTLEDLLYGLSFIGLCQSLQQDQAEMPSHGHPSRLAVSKLHVISVHHSSRSSHLGGSPYEGLFLNSNVGGTTLFWGEKHYGLSCAVLFALRVPRATAPWPHRPWSTLFTRITLNHNPRPNAFHSCWKTNSASCFLLLMALVLLIGREAQGIIGKFFLLCPIPITFFTFSLNPRHAFLFIMENVCLI